MSFFCLRSVRYMMYICVCVLNIVILHILHFNSIKQQQHVFRRSWREVISSVSDTQSACVYNAAKLKQIPSDHLYFKLKKPLIIGHMGDISQFQENTLEGVQRLISIKADGVHMQVQLTKDRKLILFGEDNLYVSHYSFNLFLHKKVTSWMGFSGKVEEVKISSCFSKQCIYRGYRSYMYIFKLHEEGWDFKLKEFLNSFS